MMMISDNDFLLRALRFNAIFSVFSALFMFIAANWLAEQFGLSSAVPIYVLAAFLLLFALQLANIVRTRLIRGWEIKSIIAGDLAWVLGSLLLVGLYYPVITAAGVMLVDVVAIAVLFFAIQQIRGLKRHRKTRVPG